MKRLHRKINQANACAVVGSFERNVLATGRRFKDLNVDTGKRELEAVPELDALPRYGDEALSFEAVDADNGATEAAV